MCRTRRISSHMARAARAADGHHRCARPRLCFSIRSPPTTSRRRARSRRIRRPANICVDHKVQADRFQSVRHAARQSRGDDARHLRQHPHQEPDGAGRRGRLHHPLSVAPAHDDLRRGDALQERARAARRVRRQGIRHRLVARLGREGHGPARRARRDRAVVRAHPSLQSGRHGRGAAGVRGRHVVADARPQGRRAGHHPRPARRSQAASAAASPRSSPPTAGSSACR